MTKVFYNARSYDSTDDQELKAFLKFVAENRAEDDFTKILKSHILRTIKSETFRREYMEMTLREHDLLYWGRQDGIKQGAHDTAIENARNFLKEGVSPEIIARCTALPLDQVLEIKDELMRNETVIQNA